MFYIKHLLVRVTEGLVVMVSLFYKNLNLQLSSNKLPYVNSKPMLKEQPLRFQKQLLLRLHGHYGRCRYENMIKTGQLLREKQKVQEYLENKKKIVELR